MNLGQEAERNDSQGDDDEEHTDPKSRTSSLPQARACEGEGLLDRKPSSAPASAVSQSGEHVDDEDPRDGELSFASKHEEQEDTDDARLYEKKWEEMFSRLVAFRNTHGHCLVPNRYTEDSALGSWGKSLYGFFVVLGLPHSQYTGQFLMFHPCGPVSFYTKKTTSTNA